MVPYLRSIAPAVASADGSTGVPDGGSCYANTLNSGPTWAASQANLRDHAVRLRNRPWRLGTRHVRGDSVWVLLKGDRLGA